MDAIKVAHSNFKSLPWSASKELTVGDSATLPQSTASKVGSMLSNSFFVAIMGGSFQPVSVNYTVRKAKSKVSECGKLFWSLRPGEGLPYWIL
jgi:hypothetical protein